MTLAIIAAIGKNRVIGKEGRLPWHISDDLKRFKRLTTGHTVLMGRKTFESIGRPLPNRRNVIVTSRQLPHVETHRSVAAALKALSHEENVFIIGGGEIYRQLLDRTDWLHLTLVDLEVDGDVFFPPFEHLLGTVFALRREEKHAGYTFVDYERNAP